MIALTCEQRVVPYADVNVQIAPGSTRLVWLALASRPNNLALVDTRWNLNLQDAVLFSPARASAVGARCAYDRSSSLAVGAGNYSNAHAKEALDLLLNLAAAAAGFALNRFGAFSGAGATAALANVHPLEFKGLFQSGQNLLECQLYLGL